MSWEPRITGEASCEYTITKKWQQQQQQQKSINKEVVVVVVVLLRGSMLVDDVSIVWSWGQRKIYCIDQSLTLSYTVL